MNFIKISKGKFMMGSPATEVGRYDDETYREVEILNDFEIMDAPVIQKQWLETMENNPSYFNKMPNNPVETVSLDDCQEFIKKLNDKKDGYLYRLPTEEEWEYCCRAGTKYKYSFGDDENELENYAWYSKNSENKTHHVKQKLPNAWGLFDMHGNVWEWTDSLYDESGSVRVIRGGSWLNLASSLRSGFRNYWGPGYRYDFVGFRLVRTLVSLGPLTLSHSDDRIERALKVASEALKNIEDILSEK